MNEFEEHPNEPRDCQVMVGPNKVCGKASTLSLMNYKSGPIPMCKGHINKLRTRAQNNAKNSVSRQGL